MVRSATTFRASGSRVVSLRKLSTQRMTAETPEKVFEDQVGYELAAGYTLSGHADGETRFTIDCQADGTFTNVGVALHVLCGAPPSNAHSTSVAAEYVFPQTVIPRRPHGRRH